MELIDKRRFTLVNGINKYVKMEIAGIFTGKAFVPKIVIHGLNTTCKEAALQSGPSTCKAAASQSNNSSNGSEVDYVDLIKETINSKIYNINVFFENSKPILRRTYEDDELLPGDFFDGAECYQNRGNGESDGPPICYVPRSGRTTGGCYEINESYEIFRKNNYYWRIELFESIKYKTNSNIKNCFNNFLIGIKNKINLMGSGVVQQHWYNLIKSLKKNMYNKIKIFDDYPSESKLSWLFQPIVDICLIVKLLNTFDSFANNSSYHCVIVSKNLDKRINSLISFFGGKISYSYSTNSINTLVPTKMYGKKFIL